MPASRPIEQRFWGKVNKTDGCWLWCSAVGSKGYGQFWVNGKTREAHRVAFELTHGSIPIGQYVCHTCDNPQCVNPAHLWLGTAADNWNDMNTKGRRVTVHEPKKLTQANVLLIRSLYATGKYSQSQLGQMFDVRQTTIGEIVRREIWKHI